MNKSIFHISLLLGILLCSMPVLNAQEGLKHARKGNVHYSAERYDDAEVEQLKSIEANSTDIRYQFNLAATKYRQEKFEDAANLFQGIAVSKLDSAGRAHAFHNLGNALLQTGKIDESIDAYKNALKLKPSDKETKYNLSYALKLKKQQEQEQNQAQQQDQQQEQDQQEQPQGGDKEQEQQEGPGQSGSMSKKDMEAMLKAIENDEKGTLDKARKKQIPAAKRKIEKDW